MSTTLSKQQASIAEVNACVSTSAGRRNAKSSTSFREWLLQNQIGISLTILTMLFAVHNLYPSLRPYTTPFLQLPHYQPETGNYVQGLDDIYFVSSAIVAFTAVRAIAIDWVFRPVAQYAGLKHKASVRFAEQAWLVVYYFGFWAYGMYLWSNSKYWFNFWEIWTDWPSRDISGSFKWYLLTQLAFWIQQIIIVNIEEKRKDYAQMFVHHVVTSTLLFSAYVYGFYNVANVVLTTMDVVDYVLPSAKILKYFGYETGATVGFVVFLLVWVVSRHMIYPILCWSIYKNVPDVMPWGTYSGITGEILSNEVPNNWGHLLYPFQNIEGPICMSPRIKWVFLGFLLFLQLLSLIWFTTILGVATKVVRTGAAEDTRSDDEGEGDEDEVDGVNGVAASNGSTGVSDNVSAEGWRKSVVSSSSSQNHHPVRIRTARGRVTLSDQNDRKALLGRIGCDKPN